MAKVSVFNRVEQAFLKSTFDFEGAWFTSAWFDNNQLTVMGFYGKKLVGSVEMTLNRSNSQCLMPVLQILINWCFIQIAGLARLQALENNPLKMTASQN